METHLELLAQSAKLFEQAKTILNKADATAEEKAQVEKVIEDAKELKKKAFELKDITDNLGDIALREEKKQGGDEEKDERKDKIQFKDWAEFLEATWYANHKEAGLRHSDPRLQYFRDKSEEADERGKKTMAGNVGASGGFLIPTEFFGQLQGAIGENSIVRQRATIIRMRRRQVDIPVLNQTGTTAGVPHWFGGMSFYWGEETAEKTASDASFRKASLVAKKLYGYTYASDELAEDSAISLGDFLSGPLGMAGGIQWMEDYAFLRGTGAGQPQGVINAGATISVAASANPPAAGTIFDDLVNMIENFLPTGRGIWVINQSHMNVMLSMNGPTANPSYIWGNAVTGQPSTLLGWPVIWSEKLPSPGTAGSILLADFRYYLLGDRQATTIESTQFDRWKYDETSWRAVHRVDGQPWLSAPLTLADGTAQVSPFVILGAKST